MSGQQQSPCAEPAEPMLREAALQVLRGWQADGRAFGAGEPRRVAERAVGGMRGWAARMEQRVAAAEQVARDADAARTAAEARATAAEQRLAALLADLTADPDLEEHPA